MGWTYGPYDVRDAYLVSSLLSCILSFCVLITYILFPRLQGKLFMKIITLISLCDFIANATVFNGEPSNHDMCVLQGLLQQFFYPASWVWTVMIAYLLYSLVTKGKITIQEWQMHAICWTIPTLCAVLPLTTETYGHHANDDDWCWIQPSSVRSSSKELSQMWQYLTFDCVIFASFIVMTYFGVVIFYRLQVQHLQTSKTVQSALNALLLYPIILFITWFPNAIVLAADREDSMASPQMVVINSLSIWQGGLTAIIFFINSRESRAHWINVLEVFRTFCCCCLIKRNKQDGDNIESRESSFAEPANLSEIMRASAVSDFVRRIRNVDNRGSNIHGPIQEDFEPDDAYYGRDTTMTTSTRPTIDDSSARNTGASISMVEINNPLRNTISS